MSSKLQETVQTYHWANKVLHWLSALCVFGLFGLGYWMVGLDYYDPWYRIGPDWHRSVGIVFAFVTCLRLGFYVLPRPAKILTHTKFERRVAWLTKGLLFVLMFNLFISGYLITTATGDSLYVFEWFSIPSMLQFDQLEEIAGGVHEKSAWSLVILALLHALAALKHHFIDKDETLKRMLFSR